MEMAKKVACNTQRQPVVRRLVEVLLPMNQEIRTREGRGFKDECIGLVRIICITVAMTAGCSGEDPTHGMDPGDEASVFPGVGLEEIRLGKKLNDYYPGLARIEQNKQFLSREMLVFTEDDGRISAILSFNPKVYGRKK
jgi:hypothetical protein